MPCVGNDAFATLPSYSVNLVCHLPFREVEAYVTLTAVLNKIGIRGKNPKVILHLHSQGVKMKIVLVRSPKALSRLLSRVFGLEIKKNRT